MTATNKDVGNVYICMCKRVRDHDVSHDCDERSRGDFHKRTHIDLE